MDYVTPRVLILDAITLAKGKAALAVRDLLIRGILAGVFLSFHARRGCARARNGGRGRAVAGRGGRVGVGRRRAGTMTA